MRLWLRKDFRIRLVRERKSIIGKGGFLIAYLKTSFRIFSSYALNWKSQLKYGSKKENRLIRRLLQGLTVGVLPIGIANRKLYPISFPWEKQWILYDLQFTPTIGPCGITQDNLKLFLSVSHAVDQQTLKRPLWEVIPVKGQGHSLIHWISPFPVGSWLLTAFSMWWRFQGSRPGCGRENPTLRLGASLVAQTVEPLPAVREPWVQSLGWEEALAKQTATHSSILSWKIPRTEEPGRLQSMGLQRVKHDWATSRHFKTGGRQRALPKWPEGTFGVQGPAWDPVEVREEPLRFPHLPHEGNQFSEILRRWQILLSWSHVSEAGSVLDSFLERQFALGVKGTVPGPELFVCSVAQPCPTLCDPMDCSPPGSSVRGILQARILEWVAMPSSRRSFQPRDRTWISCSGGQILYP